MRIFTNGRVKSATKAQAAALESEFARQPFATTLDRVRVVLEREFEGQLPIAKLNWFAIYAFGIEILTEVARRYQSKPIPRGLGHYAAAEMLPLSPADARAGWSYVAGVVDHLDDVQAYGAIHADIWDDSGMSVVWGAIRAICEKHTLKDFVWQLA